MKAKVLNKKIIFSSPFAEQKFYEQFEGKDIEIKSDDRESPELRKFFEGAVTWSWFYLHPQINWQSFKEAREDLKEKFNGFITYDNNGNKKIRANSTKMSKEKWHAFLDRIMDYYNQNGYIQWFPNSDEYNKWVNSAPAPDDIFPPLLALREMYQKEKERRRNAKPWRL